MLRKASEARYHDDEQVAEIIDKAIGLAMRAETPLPLAEAVFVKACGLYAQKQVEITATPIAGNGIAVPRG